METIDKEFTYEKYGIKFRIVGENISVYYIQNDKSIEIISKDPTCLKTRNDIFEFLREQFEEHYKSKEINDIISEMLSVYKTEKKEYKEKQKESEKLAKKEAKENKLSTKAKLIQFSDSMELFKNQEDNPYVRYVDKVAKIYPVNSSQFQEYIGLLYYRKYSDTPSDQEIKSAISVYSAKAKEGETHELNIRTCWYDNAIWYDLGNWEAVRITKDDWEIVQDVPKIFMHFDNYEPIKDTFKINKNGNIKKLLEFIDLKKENQIVLYKVILCSMFIPDIQHPIVQLSGKPGSKKSTKGKIAVGLYDNRKSKILKTANLIDFPKDPKELAKLCSNHSAICLDNVSYLNSDQSDVLSKYVTGANIEGRKLYTDNDIFSTSYQGSAFLTSVEPVFSKPDLLTRAVDFVEDVQDDDTRIDEDKFWINFEEAKGEILGGIFNLISKAMKIKDEIKLNKGVSSRMSSFLKWGCAITIEDGNKQNDFIEAYIRSKIRLNDSLIYSDKVCLLIVKFMESKSEWEGNTSQLLLQLKSIAPIIGMDEHTPGFPKDPAWLGRKINEFENNLKIYGISFIETNKAKRIYKITNNREIEKSYIEENLFIKEASLQNNCKICNKLKFSVELSALAGGGYICKECLNPKSDWSRWTCFSKDGIPGGGNCSDCSTHKEMLEYLKSNGYDKEGKKIIIQPCSKCGKETFNKQHSIIETEIVCYECDPNINQDEQEIEGQEPEEYISPDLEQKLSEYQEQLDAEEERIDKELEKEIEIPDEIC